MTKRIRAALSGALNTRGRHADVHVHIDTHGEILCEDSRCPLRHSSHDLELARFVSLRGSSL
jgi:hypothetical protein